MHGIRQIGLLHAAACLLTTTSVIGASDVEVQPRWPSPIYLAPGEQSTLVISVRNKGPDPLSSVALSTIGNFLVGPYTLTMPSQAGCGALYLGSGPANWVTTNFVVGPLAVGQQLSCHLTVSRAVTAQGDAGIGWQTWNLVGDPFPYDNHNFYAIGSLTDIGITSEPVSFRIEGNGIAVGTVRLNVRNHGPSDVDEFTVGSCADSVAPGFYINAQIPGGCGPASEPYICFDYRFAAFRVPPLTAGSQYSCLVELTSVAPYTSPLEYPIYRNGTLYVPGTNKTATRLDINAANDTAEIWLRPLGALAAAIPALDFASIALLACTIFMIGLFVLRGRSRPI